MTGPIPVEIARQQLSELISILGELRNAGPRDQRFKQWRQITVTLLQRIWPEDPSRADRFRRIPFSAPTSRSDRNATRMYFERGCREASEYLVELALELGCVVEPLSETTGAGDGETVAGMEEEAVANLPEGEGAGGEGAAYEINAPDDAFPSEEPPARHMSEPRPSAAAMGPGPAEARPATGPRPRLKDMLGFTDEPAPESAAPDHTRASEMTQAPMPDHTRAYDVSPAPAPGQTRTPEVTPPASRTQPGAPAPAPVRFKPVAPAPLRDEPSRPVRSAAPPPPAVEPPPPTYAEPAAAMPVEPPPMPIQRPAPRPVEPIQREQRPDPGRDLAAEFVLESTVLQSRARSTREPEVLFDHHVAPSPAAQDVMALAEMVEELGVPARESAILRAALIDLARQMDSPPVHWGALRDTVAFAMQHPELARRVMPLVMPYLDLAA